MTRDHRRNLQASTIDPGKMLASSVVHVDPDILGGTPVFVGTRVPARNLFDYLQGGHLLDEFLDDFPSVTREQAIAALEEAGEALKEQFQASPGHIVPRDGALE